MGSLSPEQRLLFKNKIFLFCLNFLKKKQVSQA